VGRVTAIALALALGIAGIGSAPARGDAPAPSSGLHVIPFPGTLDAARVSSIIFSSLSPRQLISVYVSGSRSRRHKGHLERLPDGAGTAFVPNVPFSAAEQVNVTATLSSPSAGTASGDPGATVLRYSFRTAIPPPPAGGTSGERPAARGAIASQSPSSSGPPVQSFVSEPGLHPVAVSATSDPDQKSGDMFLTPRLTIHASGRFGKHYHHAFQGGPMILNSLGQLVWFHPVNGTSANLEVQRYQGRPVLTWWQKATGKTDGQDLIFGRSYRPVAVVHAANGYSPDTHEFQITSQGTALIDAHVAVQANLTGVGGPPAGVVSDYVIQELDVRSGQLLWEWHALGHIPISDSYYGPPGKRPYDFLHLNSIEQLPNGNLLISGRHTWGVYLIDKQTGKIIWTLGGKHSSFTASPGARFEWQHDARLIGDTLTVFDDAAKPGFQEEPQSSVKAIRLDTLTMTATLVRRYEHYPPILTTSQGSAQTLPNGNVFVGWGASPEFSEYQLGGRQIFNGAFPLGVQSYRAYRFPWTGDPLTLPSVGLVPGADGSVKVYASWNGATEVTTWRVLGGPGAQALQRLSQAPKSGFETAVPLYSEPADFEVQALRADGRVLGTSAVAADPAHVAIFTRQAFVNESTGAGSVPVGCLSPSPCRFTLEVSAGSKVLARRTSSHPVLPGTGTLIDFSLSGVGRRDLAVAHRLTVQVHLSDASGAAAVRKLTLIRFATGSKRLPRSTSQSPAVHLVQSTGFVSSAAGQGQIVAACYASVPCPMRITVSSSGHVLAQTGREQLGIDELGALSFKLTAAGRSMLAHASGNQLPARIVISDGSERATGSIALVGY
jgi:hypothetical protein